MKQLTCEMCGGTDLLKQDGVFVCQSCGCKYSVEEAKKMMVEGAVEVTGTVKVDNSAELENLRVLARRAKDTNNTKEAEEYYYKILAKVPNDWEAVFFSLYYKSLNIKIAEIAGTSDIIKDSLKTIFASVSIIENVEEKKAAISEIVGRIVLLTENYNYNSVKQFKDSFDRMINTNSDIAFSYLNTHVETAKSFLSILLYINDELEKYEENEEFTDVLQKCIPLNNEYYIKIFVNTPTFLDPDDRMLWELLLGVATSKIIKYSETYLLPTPEFEGYPSDIKKIMKNQIQQSGYIKYCNNFNNPRQAAIGRKKEQEKRERIQKYWEEHSEEKASLEAEINSLEQQISELTTPLDSAIEEVKKRNQESIKQLKDKINAISAKYNSEINNIDIKLKNMQAEADSLGFFKMKQKKELQAQIESLKQEKQKIKSKMGNEISAVEKEIDAENKKMKQEINALHNDLNAKTEPLHNRIADINYELTKDR